MPKLKQSFLTIVVGLALAAGLSYAWIGPTAAPPDNNAPAPINISNLSQIKTGALQVNGFRNVGGSIFDGSAEFKSFIKIPTGAGVGKVLTSDSTGNATWQTPSSSKTNTISSYVEKRTFAATSAEKTRKYKYGASTNPVRCPDGYVRTGCTVTCNGGWQETDQLPGKNESCLIGENDKCIGSNPEITIRAICLKIQ